MAIYTPASRRRPAPELQRRRKSLESIHPDPALGVASLQELRQLPVLRLPRQLRLPADRDGSLPVARVLGFAVGGFAALLLGFGPRLKENSSEA